MAGTWGCCAAVCSASVPGPLSAVPGKLDCLDRTRPSANSLIMLRCRTWAVILSHAGKDRQVICWDLSINNLITPLSKNPLRIVLMWSLHDSPSSLFRQTPAARGSALSRERTIGIYGLFMPYCIAFFFLSKEGDGHLALDVSDGGPVRVGWSALAWSDDLPISRNLPTRVADASFHTLGNSFLGEYVIGEGPGI